MSAASPLQIGSARRIALTVDGTDVAALRSGGAGDPPILLVPGFTGSKEDFGPLLDPLSAAGFQVTAIDLPGQYESPGSDDPAAYAPDALARTVVEVARALGSGVRLLGHSYGGLVARAAVIAEPTAVDSLVLMCSGPGRIGDQRRALLELLAPVLADGGPEAVYAASLQVDADEPGYVAPPQALGDFLHTRFFASAPAMLRGMADALIAEPDRVEELAATGVRTLVMHGVDDVPWPVAEQKQMAHRLGAPYVVVPDAAHSPAVENPDVTAAELLRFWTS